MLHIQCCSDTLIDVISSTVPFDCTIKSTDTFMQCYGAGTGTRTVGTVTFCLGGTGTVIKWNLKDEISRQQWQIIQHLCTVQCAEQTPRLYFLVRLLSADSAVSVYLWQGSYSRRRNTNSGNYVQYSGSSGPSGYGGQNLPKARPFPPWFFFPVFRIRNIMIRIRGSGSLLFSAFKMSENIIFLAYFGNGTYCMI